LEYPYTDGFNNLFGACQLALGDTILANLSSVGDEPSPKMYRNSYFYPEVLVFINNTVFLGSRIRKSNASEMNAFEASIGRTGVWADGIHINKVAQEKTLIARLKTAAKMILTHSESIEDDQNAFVVEVPPHIDVKVMDKDALDKLIVHEIVDKLTQNANEENGQPREHYPFKGSPHCIDRAVRALLRIHTNLCWKNLLRLAVPDALNGKGKRSSENDNVFAFKLSPMDPSVIVALLNKAYEEGIRYFVIEAFGSGNGPSVITKWFQEKRFPSQGNKKKRAYCAIVTQCSKGFVSNVYGASLGEDRAPNVAKCFDMTLECAVGKLWVGREHCFTTIPRDPNFPEDNHSKLMEVSLRGELMNIEFWY
jgi:hypothetical protein